MTDHFHDFTSMFTKLSDLVELGLSFGLFDDNLIFMNVHKAIVLLFFTIQLLFQLSQM